MGACNPSVASFHALSKPSPSLSIRPAHRLPPDHICMQLGALDCGWLEFTSTCGLWSDSQTSYTRNTVFLLTASSCHRDIMVCKPSMTSCCSNAPASEPGLRWLFLFGTASVTTDHVWDMLQQQAQFSSASNEPVVNILWLHVNIKINP